MSRALDFKSCPNDYNGCVLVFWFNANSALLVQAATILNMYQAAGDAPLGRVTVSSDAYGSLPVFDEKGKLVAYEARPCCACCYLLMGQARLSK